MKSKLVTAIEALESGQTISFAEKGNSFLHCGFDEEGLFVEIYDKDGQEYEKLHNMTLNEFIIYCAQMTEEDVSILTYNTNQIIEEKKKNADK